MIQRQREIVKKYPYKPETNEASFSIQAASSSLQLRKYLSQAPVEDQVGVAVIGRFIPVDEDPEMKPIQIPLSPLLSPQQNAAKYYKDYAKAKNGEKELTRQLELGGQELEYLLSVLEELDRAETEGELEEIRQELASGGYLRLEGGRRKMKQAASKPMRFVSTDGYPIYVGRNNRQNDELTGKLAQKNDLWLHVQKLHGSHVIIPWTGVQPPDDTITQAAQLAAWFSQGRQGQNVAVDVTPVRFVKKPGGAKPGMVVYTQYRTVYVTPDPSLAGQLTP